MNFYRMLENMSNLAFYDKFYGSFSLTHNMQEFQLYLRECHKTWGEERRKSHIQTKIISAVAGHFGSKNFYSEVDPRLENPVDHCFISLLSSLYWMFDLDAVIENNLIVQSLKTANTFTDAKLLLRQFMMKQQLRSHETIPL